MKSRQSRRLLVVPIAFAIAISIGVLSFTSSYTPYRATASSSGPSPSFTGAPNETNCTACHSTFAVNSGDGEIEISGIPRNYLPGQQIPLTVTVNDSTGVLYGFQMTAVEGNGDRAGTFVVPSSGPVPIMQIVNGFVGNQNRQYIEHTIQGITPTTAGSKSWQFTWTAPSRRVGKIGFYAAGNAANSDSSSDGDMIYTTAASSLSGSAIANFFGENSSDFSVFRPSNGTWYSRSSETGEMKQMAFGATTDIPTPGDFDGDGTVDYAVYRPSIGTWYFAYSDPSSPLFGGAQWGASTDIPVAGDYDGDGKADIAVFRPTEGVWYVTLSAGGYLSVQWGNGQDIPVPGDYDGDAKTDIAVFRPSNGTWYIWGSADGLLFTQFGNQIDTPVPRDFDGDGRHDLAVFRPAPTGGEWWVLRSSGGAIGTQWGASTDIPAPGDFDGDGRADLTVFRPSTGIWYSWRTSDQGLSSAQYGGPNDIPIPSAY